MWSRSKRRAIIKVMATSESETAGKAKMTREKRGVPGGLWLRCEDCGETIPPKRRAAIPGVRTCVACQSERDGSVRHTTINRRGSKDSQLR